MSRGRFEAKAVKREVSMLTSPGVGMIQQDSQAWRPGLVSSVVSFLLMCLLPPPSNVNPFHLPPKKKIVKGRDYWGSEPDGQLERE